MIQKKNNLTTFLKNNGCLLTGLTLVMYCVSPVSADQERIQFLEDELRIANEIIYKKEMRIRNLQYEKDRLITGSGVVYDQDQIERLDQLTDYSEQIENKELVIRNLRRRVFDLESQIPGNSNNNDLLDTITELKRELRMQRNQLRKEHEQKIDELDITISQLNSEIESLNKERISAQSEQLTQESAAVTAIEKQLQQKSEELIKAQELITKVVDQKTAAEEKNASLESEVKKKTKELAAIHKKNKNLKAKQDDLIKKAQKPLNKKIGQLEASIKDLQKDSLVDQDSWADEKDKLSKKYKAQIKDLDTKLSTTQAQVKDLKKYNAVQSKDIDKLTSESKKLTETITHLTNAKKANEQPLVDKITALENKIEKMNTQIAAKDKGMSGLEFKNIELLAEIKGLNEKITDTHEQLANKDKDLKNTQKPLVEKIVSLEKQINEGDLKIKLLDEEKKSMDVKNADQKEQLSVYKRLVNKQDEEIANLKKDFSKNEDEIERIVLKRTAELQSKFDELEKENKRFDITLNEERFKIKKELKSDMDDLQNQLSAQKIDIEYKQAQIDKLLDEKEKFETSLVIAKKATDDLANELTELKLMAKSDSGDKESIEQMTEKNKELTHKLDILIKENADYQKLTAQYNTRMEEFKNTADIQKELREAQELVTGFKKDADNKTMEISSLSDENYDLRRKLKEYIQQKDELNSQLKEFKKKTAGLVDQAELDDFQTQINSLRTALSKARQLIAQKDVSIADLTKDQEILRKDIMLLTDQLNIKIQQIGELDFQTRRKGEQYSQQEMDTIKKPLLMEITALKERVKDLEQQLVETWDSAENMLIELKNHPEIKQVDNQVVEKELNKFQ